MREKFVKDLETGKVYEKKALELIQKKYPKAFIQDGYFLEWDIYIPELDMGVEVKSDAQYKKTGNFYVEYECNDKPSGIATTKAKYYYIYLDKLYILKTEDLKDKCRKYLNTKKDKKGGDNMASKGIIIPINEL
jgi:hypothetical protein|tara:strand:- start:125 stop:526 length:402 start_codon:yes stop_codon:yes gene_type:complete